MSDLIGRQDAINAIYHHFPHLTMDECRAVLHEVPSAQPDKDMIHLQKEQAYMQGWEDGQKALREEIWEDGRDRLD